MSNRLKTVEEAVFAYLETLLTGDRGDLGEFPRAAEAVDVNHWMFGFTGGSEVFIVEKEKNTFAWTMTAAFRGIYTDRDTALLDLWTVMDNMPLSETEISEIHRVDPISPPTIDRQVVRLENDLTAGGETRVWAVEMMLEITFPRA